MKTQKNKPLSLTEAFKALNDIESFKTLSESTSIDEYNKIYEEVAEEVNKVLGTNILPEDVIFDDSRSWSLYVDGHKLGLPVNKFGAFRNYNGGGVRGPIMSNGRPEDHTEELAKFFEEKLKEVEALYNKDAEGMDEWDLPSGVLSERRIGQPKGVKKPDDKKVTNESISVTNNENGSRFVAVGDDGTTTISDGGNVVNVDKEGNAIVNADNGTVVKVTNSSVAADTTKATDKSGSTVGVVAPDMAAVESGSVAIESGEAPIADLIDLEEPEVSDVIPELESGLGESKKFNKKKEIEIIKHNMQYILNELSRKNVEHITEKDLKKLDAEACYNLEHEEDEEGENDIDEYNHKSVIEYFELKKELEELTKAKKLNEEEGEDDYLNYDEDGEYIGDDNDSDDYDRRAVEKEYDLEDGELDDKSVREAERIVGEEQGALDRFVNFDESKENFKPEESGENRKVLNELHESLQDPARAKIVLENAIGMLIDLKNTEDVEGLLRDELGMTDDEIDEIRKDGYLQELDESEEDLEAPVENEAPVLNEQERDYLILYKDEVTPEAWDDYCKHFGISKDALSIKINFNRGDVEENAGDVQDVAGGEDDNSAPVESGEEGPEFFGDEEAVEESLSPRLKAMKEIYVKNPGSLDESQLTEMAKAHINFKKLDEAIKNNK